MSSATRPGGVSYLPHTIQSLVNNTTPEQQQSVVIVIFLSDFDVKTKRDTAQGLYNKFKHYCDSGFIQIIQTPWTAYPNFNKLKKTRFDSLERVKWRSKQNLDYSYLMQHSVNISKYYIQLEDDVISAEGYLRDITAFVNVKEIEDKALVERNVSQIYGKWQCLEFSQLGFIGKLFRSTFLNQLAKRLTSKYNINPCDILLGEELRAGGQLKPIHYSPALFQHIGKWSSLKNKLSGLVDKTFKDIGQTNLEIISSHNKNNPPAKIETNILFKPGCSLKSAYNHHGYCESRARVSKSNFIKIVLDKPLTIKRIVLSSGHPQTKLLIIKWGEVKVSANCNRYSGANKFKDGEYDSEILGVKLHRQIKCIYITISRTHPEPIIINSIDIFQQ